MKCIIPGVNIKVFGRAIHSLSKIGDEVYFEPLEHGLALRTVNSSRSAYGCFMFAPTFFTDYDDGSGQIRTEDSEEEAIRCKVAMKSCLTIFKSMSTIEKTVERCKIKLNMKECRLVFQLHCKHGIVKTHNLAFIECETLQAVFSKDMSPIQLTAQAKLLADAVVNFQTNQEEITLLVSPQKISLKNYVDDEPDPNKIVHTVVHLDPDEFDRCQVGVDTDITFCLKELRAILGFAEALNMPLNITFESAGRPVIFGINSDTAFEANLVLATLADSQTQTSASQQPSTSTKAKTSQKVKVSGGPRASERGDNQTKTSVRPSTSEKGDNQSNFAEAERSNRSDRMEAALDAMMDEDFDSDMMISDLPTIHEETHSKNSHAEINTHNYNEIRSKNRHEEINNSDHKNINGKSFTNRFGNHLDKVSINNTASSANNSDTRQRPGTSGTGGWLNKSTHMLSPNEETQQSQSPVVPNQSLNKSATDTILQEEEDDEDFVPGTPPSKKFRSLFFGMSQASTSSQMSQLPKPTPAVLVEDSDSD